MKGLKSNDTFSITINCGFSITINCDAHCHLTSSIQNIGMFIGALAARNRVDFRALIAAYVTLLTLNLIVRS